MQVSQGSLLRGGERFRPLREVDGVKRQVWIFAGIPALAVAVLTAGCRDSKPKVPDVWRPKSFKGCDFFSRPQGRWMEEPECIPWDKAAFKHPCFFFGGWGAKIGVNDIAWYNEYTKPEERFENRFYWRNNKKVFNRLPYTVWDTMGPDYEWSKKRATVRWWQKNRPDVPFWLGSQEGTFPYFMKDRYDCDRAHFAEWLKEFPNFMGFAIMNEGVFAITDPDCEKNGVNTSGAYQFTTNAEMRAQMEKDFPPTNYCGRVHWMKKAMERERACFFGTDRFSRLVCCDAKLTHQAGKYGIGAIQYEVAPSTTGEPWAPVMWHLRGAARQFGIVTDWYVAPLFLVCTRDGKRTARMGEWRTKNRIGPNNRENFGLSRTCAKSAYHYVYFAGINSISVEQSDQCFYDDTKEGICVPSPYFDDYNSVYELAEKCPRGIAWTPVAVLSSIYEPYSPSGSNFGGCRESFAPDAFFFTLLPIPEAMHTVSVVDRSKGKDGCMYNFAAGEICDVVCPDAGQAPEVFSKVLAPYKAAFLIGCYPEKDQYDLASVRNWVRNGGLLVCSEDMLGEGLVTEDMTGVTFGGETAKSGRKLLDSSGAEIDDLVDDYTFYKGRATSARPYYRDEKGNVVAYFNTCGKGRVITIAAELALPDHLFKRNYTRSPEHRFYVKLLKVMNGTYRFPIYSRLVEEVEREFVPFEVKGDVQWGVNLVEGDEAHWLVWLINNKGYRHFQGEDDEFDESATATVEITLKRTGEKRTCRVGPGRCRYEVFK